MKFVSAVLAFAAVLSAQAQQEPPSFTIKVSADFLGVQVSGKAPQGTTALEYRLAESGVVPEGAPWLPVEAFAEGDGAFALKLPLKTPHWSEVQVRSMRGGEVLAQRESRREGRSFQMLTSERIAALPEPERKAWTEYLQRSNERSEKDYETLAAECRKLGLAHAKPAASNRAQFAVSGSKAESWFGSGEAQRLAEVVLSYQTPSGGWSKAVRYSDGPRQPGTHWTTQTGEGGWHYCGTIDNRSTTEQLHLLAGVYGATKREDTREALMRGLEWLFAAQFPNGGWPQNYPVEPGYHEAITLNDDAMTHVLEVMLDISEAKAPFAFADDALRQRARAAFDRGIACLAAAQVKVDGRLTVWCAQHDPLSLTPVAARKKEPASLSGAESASLLKFLMRRAPLEARISAMIEPAVAWLDAHRITGLRYAKNADGKTDYVPDATSGEVYWARFYDVETGRPLFYGGQDGIAYATFGEMAAHNRLGYDYYTTKPHEVIDKEVARWRKRMEREK
jgi:PelA/Pel-15E family pectate lyase